ncbi:MAG: bifunctional [glutamate--ammonia ligase]-adenylyl-L-tyrosine phosphorylase/[glutamate--ammonia-ligase] adenylyltransferase [Pasteurellaceae bacterium]|nr:bifunctional [glutamate--ammonia ligase]-adenylyl-L-tyrosine phosphorylase/[glutamate--ammonia-ligase] adenylyltransferase [Pasteurellaceae bacterium]
MTFSTDYLHEVDQQLAEIAVIHFPEQHKQIILEQIQSQKKDVNAPCTMLARAIAMSPFVAEVLRKQADLFQQCWHHALSFDYCQHYDARLAQQLASIQDENQLYRELRQFRYREMAKLSICQSLNLASVEQIFIQLSKLAESLIIASRDWLYQQACIEMGTPVDEQGQPQQLYILGMGKLGGFELNFSSDIDLIFTYPSQGETMGVRRPVDNAKFFTRLGQRLINALDRYTSDGFVYRTDMRLRPFGESGALALSFTALENYYQEQGRDWERYAMIKARILGSNEQDPHINALRQLLRPFVYRRYIDFSVIQSLRDMKRKIEREIRRRGLVDNIKLGRGGIREIEFIVQVFQLIRGGREVTLQQTELLKLLPEIKRLALLPSEQCTQLRQAYLFLRRVENVLQAIDDKQTQLLPTTEIDRQRLVCACAEFVQLDPQGKPIWQRYPIQDWTSFYAVLQQHQQQVQAIFEQLIGDENNQNKMPDSTCFDLFDDGLTNEELDQWLLDLGMPADEIEKPRSKIQTFCRELNRRAVGVRGREVLSQLLPNLLREVLAHQQYLILLPRILNIIEKILTRTTYLELLQENPQALTQLIELCAQSQMIAEQVARYPILLDELLNPQTLHNPTPFSEYGNELRQYLLRIPSDNEEMLIDALRQFKQACHLRIASADIVGALPVMKVSDHLTFLAEAILAEVIHLAWQQVSYRFGVPAHLAENEKGFAVIGYGKLGGIELGYQSDLDLVFLYDSSRQSDTVGGKKQIDSNQFYLKLAQKIISIFSMNTSAGVLYDIDTRLRPSGEAGPLVSSFHAFEQYQQQDAWTWEQQALVRARVVFGDAHLQQQFEHIRRAALAKPRNISQLKRDVVAMRQKMYQYLANTNPTQFNLKTDKGGITDIEFIAQYLVLAHAQNNPELTRWSDNVRIFEQMATYNVLSQQDAEQLKDCYTSLRNRIHHLNLLGLPNQVSTQEFIPQRQFVQQIWQRFLVD